MVRWGLVKQGQYQDSVRLLRIGEALRALRGVEKVGVVMATPVNRGLLEEGGLLTPEGRDATPNDLIIAVSAATDEALSRAIAHAEELLSRPSAPSGRVVCKTLSSAIAASPEADIALISVPGEYAAAEARRALDRGLHVLIFSDNVPLEDEIALKRLASERGLLVMGSDCGTAVLGGAGLGFTNAVSGGWVGIVAASGTGAQAVSVALEERGLGLSHLIGTGGRDATDAVGAITMLQGIRALSRDASTRVIVVISKVPGPGTLARLLAEFEACEKPLVAFLLGAHFGLVRAVGAFPALSLDHAADLAREVAEGAGGREARPSAWAAALDLSEGLPADGRLRGLFAGGTLAQEAHAILAALLPDLRTNFSGPLSDSDLGGHAVLDLGADEYTVRRPHPMMDPSSQGERSEAAAEAGGVSILLIDVVLGYGSHRDPAGVLAPAAERAIRRASSKGRGLAIVASVCGTAGDPQNREDQESRLRDAGVFVERDNARAAAIAGFAAVAAEGRPAGAAGPPADLPATARVINVGTDWFADALEDQGVPVVQVDWSPPAGGDKDLAAILQRLG